MSAFISILRTIALTLALCAGTTQVSLAQHRLVLHGGLVQAGMDGGTEAARIFNDHVNGWQGGVGWAMPIKGGFDLRSGLLYERRGASGPIIWLDLEGTEIGSSSSRYLWDHVSLPVAVGFRTDRRLGVNGALGVVPAYTLAGRFIGPAGPFSGETTMDIRDASSSWTMGASAEFGLSYRLADHLGVVLGVRYYHGILPMELGVLSWRQRSVGMLCGFEYLFGKGGSGP